MKRLRLFLPVCTLFFLFSCFGTQKTGTTGTDDGIIDITFLQLNDVYEIAPLGDNTGGMARVASIRKELLAENPNTFTVLAGDFISPSVTGTLKYEGQRIRGRQMVDVLNTLGLDWVVFGNHEFDYDLSDLQARLDQSDFVWMAANARLLENDAAVPFYKNRNNVKEPCPDQQIIMVKDKDGTSIKLGLFGVLITSGKKPWVQYSDPVAAAKQQYSVLKNNADVVVGLTHRDIVDDLALAAEIPGVPLWMGGHDHTNMFHKVGTAVVAKADANARTVYIHRLQYNTKTHKTTVKSELRSVNASIADEPATAAVVAKWETIKEDALKVPALMPGNP
ncbi:MAG: metallophosphoesterase [Lewinellaceae bacterium]|nr:metallophosphoesterase [Lewinellaceae bacterium]